VLNEKVHVFVFINYVGMYLLKINKIKLRNIKRDFLILYSYICLLNCQYFISLTILLVFINEYFIYFHLL